MPLAEALVAVTADADPPMSSAMTTTTAATGPRRRTPLLGRPDLPLPR